MTIKQAFAVIADLQKIRDHLKDGIETDYSEVFWYKASQVRKYDREIERLKQHIMNQELDDKFEPNKDLYIIGENDAIK